MIVGSRILGIWLTYTLAARKKQIFGFARTLKNWPQKLALDASLGCKRPQATLFLSSKRAGHFDSHDRDLLEACDVPEILRMALANYERDEHQLALKLLRELADTGTASQLARCLVEGLVRIREWEHVAVFKVNQVRSYFELLAQASLKGGELFSSGYRQALDSGVLRDGVPATDASAHGACRRSG